MLARRKIIDRLLRRGSEFLPRPRPKGPVSIHINGVTAEVEPGSTILEACEKMGIELEHCCGGESTCGTCRVNVMSGARNLSKAQPRENGTLEGVRENKGDRLGCQVRIFGPAQIEIPEDWRSL